jgi:hypothetical protein
MQANVKWLYAFWRASRALNDPAGRGIAKLDEWALTKLGSQVKGQMSARDWLHYLRGAMAALGVEASLDEAYHEGEDSDGYFALEDGSVVKRRLVMWTPGTETFSLGVYWANMTRYVFAVLRRDGEVMVLTKTAYPDLVKELLVLVHAVAGEEWKRKVMKAMEVSEDA